MGLQKLEETLDGWYKKAPQMPESTRKSLAGAFWWIALVLGILQLWGAWALWRLAHYLDPINRAADYVNQYYGYNVVDNSLNFFYYSAILIIVVDAAILLLAAPALKAWKKIGWTLLFYSLLLNVVYGVARMFSDVGGGFGNVLWALVTAAIAGYFLFQVRSFFVKAGGVDLKMDSSSGNKPKTK
ncbi:MAG TPA: hypothetical protein VFB59_01790 [Candidatus Saccharimonadales bacterium]|nr:hypothetical protein [Candidatus Saccharimonadales bacterium]